MGNMRVNFKNASRLPSHKGKEQGESSTFRISCEEPDLWFLWHQEQHEASHWERQMSTEVFKNKP